MSYSEELNPSMPGGAALPAPLPSIAGEQADPAGPVPHNQWTRARMVAFLRELAATQSVSAAAKAVGMSRTAAYNLRNRLQGQPFALGWEVALECGMHALAQAVMDRDALLVRIEFASLTWEKGEAVPGPGWPHRTRRVAEESEAQFLKQSWYMADGNEHMQRRGRPGR